jgi:hypothetical protein
MVHREAKIASSFTWEEEKPGRKKALAEKRYQHKQTHGLRTLTQLYGRNQALPESTLSYLEDCWE